MCGSGSNNIGRLPETVKGGEVEVPSCFAHLDFSQFDWNEVNKEEKQVVLFRKAADGFLNGRVKVEDSAQFGDDEEALDFFRCGCKLQIAAGIPHRCECADEHAQSRTVHRLDACEVDDDFLLPLIDERVECVVQCRGIRTSEHASFKPDDGDAINVLG